MGGPARWEEFDGASHFLPMEQPLRLAALVVSEVTKLG
jgi:pimeloyl-ACP methyl ester carboxylesterase